MNNVFNDVAKYEELLREIEYSDGVLTEDQEQQLLILESEVKEKVVAFYHCIKTLESQIQVAKDEKERLTSVINVKENLIKRLNQQVALAVDAFGSYKKKAVNKSLVCDDLQVSLKKTESIDILNEFEDNRFVKKEFAIITDLTVAKKLISEFKALGIESKIDNKYDKKALKDWITENKDNLESLKIAYFNNELSEDEYVPIRNEVRILESIKITPKTTAVFK